MSEYSKLHAALRAQHKQRQRARIEAEHAVLVALDTLTHWDPNLWGPDDVSRIERSRQALQQIIDQRVLD